jgi:hypothetical protein
MIGEQVAEIEAASRLAETRLAALTEICQRFIAGLSGAIEGLYADDDPAQLAQDAVPVPVATVAVPEPRMSREESRRRNAAIDTAVLSVLTEEAGSDVRVVFIAKRIVLDGMTVSEREVSQSLQRLVKRNDVDVRPGLKKGYWTAVAMTATQPTENGTPVARQYAEEPSVEPAPLPSEDALEEMAGVVAGAPDVETGW